MRDSANKGFALSIHAVFGLKSPMRTSILILAKHALSGAFVCLLSMLAHAEGPGGGQETGSAKTKYVALVIGNADYSSRPLPNAVNDARSVAKALEALGYEVTESLNAGEAEMATQLERFMLKRQQGSVSLLYYSGHARMENGETVLTPVDATVDTAERGNASALRPTGAGVAESGLRLQPLLLRAQGTRQLVLLDVCLTAADDMPQASMALPPDSLVVHAAQPGKGAGDTATNGIFTARLLRSLAAPARSAELLLAETAKDVLALTAGRQQPWIASTLHPRARLSGDVADSDALMRIAASASEAVIAYDTRGVLPKDTNEQYELTFWESIKDSNHISDYEAYLQTYPKGRFAGLAKARIERLRAAAPKEAPKEAAKEPPKEAPKEPPKEAAKETPARPAPKAAEPPRAAQPKVRPAPAPAATSPAPSAPAVAETAPPSAPAQGKAAGEAIKDCPTCPDLVSLPAGSFVMGSNSGDPSEKPEHRVTIPSAFAIGRFEVTMEQWNACVDTGGCTKVTTDASRPKNVPVRDVSWEDAQQYVKWLTKVTGKPYRLPTEAEWEYAARGGTSTKFWWGEQMRKGTANCKECGDPWQADGPVPVGSFPPNPFGLHDLNGSVWEWVQDCWHTSFKGAPSDGKSWEDPNCRVRVIRGGSWRENATYMPSSTRFKYDSNVRQTQNGFRVVRDLK
jgi:formylglycine-generating enzyme required for sulfatase activity